MSNLAPRHYSFILLIALVLCVDAIELHLYSTPVFISGTAEYPEHAELWINPPYIKSEKGLRTKFNLKEIICLPTLFPRIFTIYPQDVLWSIKVNGNSISSPNLPLAVIHSEGHTFNLGPFLHPGYNEIDMQMEVYWGTASAHYYISPLDWSSLLTFVFVGLAVFCAVFSVHGLLKYDFVVMEYNILCGGIALLFIYMSGTPYFIRSYDVAGHTSYIDYVSGHLSLPNAGSGWETFQPPTYYLLLGWLTDCCKGRRWNLEQRCALWQTFSWLVMSGAVVAAATTGRIVFPGVKNNERRAVYLAIVVVLPAFVFNASRVSNDVLFAFFGFWWFTALIWFWISPSLIRGVLLATLMNLALITKANGLSFLPITAVCIVLHPQLSVWRRSLMLSGLTALFILEAGWYYFPRFLVEHRADEYIVGNIQQLNPKAHVPDVFWSSLVFNPVKILEYPFVQPWGPRHEFFGEYFFKSAFLGEWWMSKPYKWIARIFMVCSLWVLLFFLKDMWIFLRGSSCFKVPITVTIIFVLSAHWIFLQCAPYMSTQDFRYSLVILLPIAIVLNINRSSGRRLPLLLNIGNCVYYILAIST